MSDLIVRLTVVGRASRRWRGARNAAQAGHLNQELSEARARNLRKPVEDILKRELPGVQIEVPAMGLGSDHGFPLTGEDNAPIDRSVVVVIEVTQVSAGSKTGYRPIKLYAPSKIWTLKVVAMVNSSFGGQATFIRVKVRNTTTGRELTLAGHLYGGHLNPKAPFGFDHDPPSSQVGDEVTFETENAEDFDFWIGPQKGQSVRVVHAKVGALRKRETTFLQFTGVDTQPGSLVFEYKKGWSMPTVDISVVSGFLHVEGPAPSDYVDDTRMVTIPTQDVHPSFDGLLVSFPTGKAGWNDLTPKDQTRLTDFVTNKARGIAAIGSSGFNVTNPDPKTIRSASSH